MERFTSRVNGEITAPKSKASSSAVPVIRQLQERLAMHRLRCGEPSEGWMFSTGNGTPLSLQNVVNRLILPALERQGRVHDWHGFHAARRGLGSNLYRLGISDKVIQAILRHANVSVTLSYYVKSTSADVAAAMEKLEAKIAEDSRDTNGTPKADPGASCGFVN